MRLSEITTEVYGCTISVFMILASCHYVLSETQNSIPIMHWRWTINLLKLSLMNWRRYHMKSLIFFWVIPMKLLTPITFLPLGSSFNFCWDFINFLAKLKLSPTYLFNRLHRSHKYFVHFLSYFKIRIAESKRKPPLFSLIKRSLSTFINKCLIVIQRESTLTL